MNEKEHSIRFIDSRYNTLFRIPDGETVEIRFPDRRFTAKCKFLDEYHTATGNNLFHICEFAELLEKQNGTVSPEPEITAEKAAWRLGHEEFLLLQRTDTGYDYTIYNRDLSLLDGGQLDDPDLTMKQAREQILEMHGYARKNRFEASFDDILEKAESLHDSVLSHLRDLSGKRTPAARTEEKRHVGKEER